MYSLSRLRMEQTQYQRSLKSETLEQERLVAESLAPFLSKTPIPLKASTFFVPSNPTHDEHPSTCKVHFVGTILSATRQQIEITIVSRQHIPDMGVHAEFCVTLANFHRFL